MVNIVLDSQTNVEQLNTSQGEVSFVCCHDLKSVVCLVKKMLSWTCHSATQMFSVMVLVH